MDFFDVLLYKEFILIADNGERFTLRIPYVCKQCGNCCTEFPPSILAGTKQEIADYLFISVEQLEYKYLSKKARRESPCPFFVKHRGCSIYPYRPEGCVLYPLETFGGTCGTDCAGDKRFQELIGILTKGYKIFEAKTRKLVAQGNPNWACDRPTNRGLGDYRDPPDDEIERLRKRYLDSKPFSREKNFFLMINPTFVE
ncbi:MAG: hypothetical protein BAJATHORv1_40346 [Candidatus Thorarchaeota archaeon]|nr:MAG: hypothetical protein BAJATHORv1_40346 [Candidatus Thorarchaeota archaeon]